MRSRALAGLAARALAGLAARALAGLAARALSGLAALLLLGCLSNGDDDRDRDRDRDLSQAEERARRYCVDEATVQGWRVEKVGRIEKVDKKEYEVKLRVTPRMKQLKKEKGEEEDRVLCRYDDKSGDAQID